MPGAQRLVLAINAGSSTIKFRIYPIADPLVASLEGKIDRVGVEGTTLSWTANGTAPPAGGLTLPRTAAPAPVLLDWLSSQGLLPSIAAVGHRVVHGLARTAPVVITPDVLVELRRAEPFAPEHLPREIELIDAFQSRVPHALQVACFDTAFHSGMPLVAKLLPIPRRYFARGVMRYGFHGLSYAYLMEELGRAAGAAAARGRVVLAHLGNGASLAAVKDGRSLDTTMGFTPAAGLVMSTRTGDLDPGLVSFLVTHDRMTVADFDRMVNHESGLLGVSEVSSDMRDLLAREPADPRAAEAVALFCYQAKKGIGALAAALGGIDTLVFSAGIGERSAVVRARICEGLEFLGVELDPERNAAHAPIISADASRVAVRVIPTDEERMIARSVVRMLEGNGA